MIQEFLQRRAISAEDSAQTVDRFLVQSELAYIRQTNAPAPFHVSSAADRAFLQKASRNLVIASQTEEMPPQMIRDPQPSQPGHATADRASQIPEKLALGRPHLVLLLHW